MNVLFDEVEVPAEIWSRAPRYVSIALTNTCELRCPFCYAPKNAARLDPASVVAWIEELSAHGCLGVGFGGGEPTAHPSFAWICKEAERRTSVAVTFTTHGHRLDERLADELKGSVHFVRVSVDGIGTTYERIRGRSFDSLIECLRRVANLSPFGLNVVVNDETIDELDAVASFAQAVGAVELLLLPQQPVGNCRGISDRAAKRLQEWLTRATFPLRLAISQLGLVSTLPVADAFPGEPLLEAHAHLDAAGVLRPHAYSAEGAIVRTSIMEALEELRLVGAG